MQQGDSDSGLWTHATAPETVDSGEREPARRPSGLLVVASAVVAGALLAGAVSIPLAPRSLLSIETSEPGAARAYGD